jgi:hypothetical protein
VCLTDAMTDVMAKGYGKASLRAVQRLKRKLNLSQ